VQGTVAGSLRCDRRQNASAVSFLASIPSPSSGTVEIGPLTIHMYGLTLLVAIAVCT
jgi:hypothetical protein